jgi:hypothetical protein
MESRPEEIRGGFFYFPKGISFIGKNATSVDIGTSYIER